MHHVCVRYLSFGEIRGMNFIFRFCVYLLGKNQKVGAQKWLSAGPCLPCVLVHTLPLVCQEICISMNFKTFRKLLSQWTFTVFEIFLTRADPWCFLKEALMSSLSYILATPIYLRLGGSEVPLYGFSTLESTLILLFLCPTVFVSSASNQHRSSPIRCSEKHPRWIIVRSGSVSTGVEGQPRAAHVLHGISGGIVEMDHQVSGPSMPPAHVLPTKIHGGGLWQLMN